MKGMKQQNGRKKAPLDRQPIAAHHNWKQRPLNLLL